MQGVKDKQYPSNRLRFPVEGAVPYNVRCAKVEAGCCGSTAGRYIHVK